MNESEKNIPNIETEKVKEFPRRVFVEVGSGINPVPALGNKRFIAPDTYIGMDINEADLTQGKRVVEHLPGKEAESIFFVKSDKTKLPLADNSVSELFLGNVFGEASMSRQEVTELLTEVARVVRVDGRVVIKETNTPVDMFKLSKLLADSGLEISQAVGDENPQWLEKVAAYDTLAHGVGARTGKFLLSARKKKGE